MGFWLPFTVWLIQRATFPLTLRYRRQETSALREKNSAGPAADGVFRIHLSSPRDWLGNFAACGAYVESIGGRSTTVTCRACKRIMRRAGHLDLTDPEGDTT